uniref:Uncharacterized protein n=1 Tax=Ditylenchus dipsaci TaxID=166011 RepID=A0A915EN47_9BILA
MHAAASDSQPLACLHSRELAVWIAVAAAKRVQRTVDVKRASKSNLSYPSMHAFAEENASAAASIPTAINSNHTARRRRCCFWLKLGWGGEGDPGRSMDSLA